MLANYLKVAVRALLRDRVHSLLSILGLAIGLGISMVSISYIVRELRWENCHEKHDRIFRVEMQYHHADTAWSSARIMGPLAGVLAEEIPGIEKAAVFRRDKNVALKVNNNTYPAGHLLFAQPDFFEVFTFPLKTGDPRTALRNPHSVLITDSLAGMYFPNHDPVGETIVLNDETEYTITGVLENVPPLTQLHCDFVASYSTLNRIGANMESWTGAEDYAYLLLDNPADADFVAARIPHVFSRHVADETFQRYTFSLKPLKDIYFTTYFSGNKGEIWPGGEYDVLIIVICIGLFILIQAIINFVNLATARAADRMKEVGIRKTFGAGRAQLVPQFLGESMILTFAATFIGLFFYDFFRNGYLAVTPDTYELVNLYSEPGTMMLIVLLAVIVGISAGMYPALYLSRFKPMSILNDQTASGPSRSLIRKSLAVFQFTLAIFFIILTVGHYHQLRFITQYDLGFEQENILVLRFEEDEHGAAECALAKNEIPARTNVLGTARSSGVFGSSFSYTLYYTDPARDETERKVAKLYAGDYDIVSFYGLEIIEGREFSPEIPEDIDHAILISESLKEKLALPNPIGYRLYTDSAAWEIVGVVRDFQGAGLSLKYSTESIITLNPESCRVLCVKLQPENIGGSVAAIGATWEQLFGDREFNYSFLDDDIRARFGELDSIVSLFTALSVISIVIACLGIFGLVLYTVKRKTKETAIRKVLGASTSAISKLLTREFVTLIMLSNLIACPLAYLMISWTFGDFAYRTSLGIGTYLSGGLITLIIVLVTSSFHIIKAVRANPIDAIRYQ